MSSKNCNCVGGKSGSSNGNQSCGERTDVDGCRWCDAYSYTRKPIYQTVTFSGNCKGNKCGTEHNKKNYVGPVETCTKNGAINPEMSLDDTKRNKQKTVLEGIDTLKPTIYSDIASKELFSKTTEEQYKEYFRKLSHSALSLSEQALLLDQMSTDFIDNNALNLFINVQNIASKNKNPVDNKKIKEVINQTMKNVLPNIITSYNYGDDFLKMNYANAYQTMYYATSLYSYKNKWPIIYYCYQTYVSNEE